MRPDVGRARPAISLNSVDFPDPDRPSRPTIWPSARLSSTPSSTSSSLPSGFGNARRTARTSSRGTAFMLVSASSQPELPFRTPVERTPERPVDDHDEEAHDRDPEDDPVIVRGLGGPGDIGAEPVRLEPVMAPGGDL